MIGPTDAELASAVRVVARAIAAEMLSAARETDAEWVDLRSLDLGRKRGPELCRRWLNSGRSGVIQVGREWRVHRDVLTEFFGGVAPRPPRPEGAMGRIERRLALVGGVR